MNTQTSCLDPETLAAFIDGQLAEAERRVVVEHMADCEDCYEVMAESMHLRQALAEEEAREGRPHLVLVPDPEDPERSEAPKAKAGAPGVDPAPRSTEETPRRPKGAGGGPGSEEPPPRASKEGPASPERKSTTERRLGTPKWWRTLAASLAVGGLGLALLWPMLRPGSLARELSAAALPQGWEEHDWAALTRSGASPEEKAQAFRLGTHHRDLEIALLGGRVAAAKTALAGLFREGSDVVFPRHRYRTLEKALDSQGPGEALGILPGARKQLLLELQERALGASFHWGAWAEAGRLAVAAGDAPVLRGKSFRKEARGLLESDLEVPIKDEVRSVLETSKFPLDATALSELEKRFEKILQRSGRL